MSFYLTEDKVKEKRELINSLISVIYNADQFLRSYIENNLYKRTINNKQE